MKKIISLLVLITFIITSLPHLPAQAQGFTLPIPGKMLELSKAYMPVMVKGLLVNPKEPFKFDFVVDSGDTGFKGAQLKDESMKLIKYFLAALTVPEEEMWVNLSPYEKDRMIPKSFGDTEMGRDLLAQDYILKQLTASLTYPEKEMGKKFWDKVYAQAQEKFGTSNIPLNTFNKVWIIPSKAQVYEHGNGAFVVESHLKVMVEEDYLALEKNKNFGVARGPVRETTDFVGDGGQYKVVSSEATKNLKVSRTAEGQDPKIRIGSQILREIIIPALEQEVNEGAHFANLRQIYQAMILATWYKIRLKNSIIGKLYVDQGKTKGVALEDKQDNENIYQQYLAAFKKGAYNYIKEDASASGETVPRKYVSGGFTASAMVSIVTDGLADQTLAMASKASKTEGDLAMVEFQANKMANAAMLNIQANNPRPMSAYASLHGTVKLRNGREVDLMDLMWTLEILRELGSGEESGLFVDQVESLRTDKINLSGVNTRIPGLIGADGFLTKKIKDIILSIIDVHFKDGSKMTLEDFGALKDQMDEKLKDPINKPLEKEILKANIVTSYEVVSQIPEVQETEKVRLSDGKKVAFNDFYKVISFLEKLFLNDRMHFKQTVDYLLQNLESTDQLKQSLGLTNDKEVEKAREIIMSSIGVKRQFGPDVSLEEHYELLDKALDPINYYKSFEILELNPAGEYFIVYPHIDVDKDRTAEKELPDPDHAMNTVVTHMVHEPSVIVDGSTRESLDFVAIKIKKLRDMLYALSKNKIISDVKIQAGKQDLARYLFQSGNVISPLKIQNNIAFRDGLVTYGFIDRDGFMSVRVRNILRMSFEKISDEKYIFKPIIPIRLRKLLTETDMVLAGLAYEALSNYVRKSNISGIHDKEASFKNFQTLAAAARLKNEENLLASLAGSDNLAKGLFFDEKFKLLNGIRSIILAVTDEIPREQSKVVSFNKHEKIYKLAENPFANAAMNSVKDRDLVMQWIETRAEKFGGFSVDDDKLKIVKLNMAESQKIVQQAKAREKKDLYEKEKLAIMRRPYNPLIDEMDIHLTNRLNIQSEDFEIAEKVSKGLGIYKVVVKGTMNDFNIAKTFAFVINRSPGNYKVIKVLTDEKVNKPIGRVVTMYVGLVNAELSISKRPLFVLPSDRAMSSMNDLGGIDLNSKNLDLQIKRDSSGMPLPFEFQNLDQIKFDALYPVITSITPLLDLPKLLGIPLK